MAKNKVLRSYSAKNGRPTGRFCDPCGHFIDRQRELRDSADDSGGVDGAGKCAFIASVAACVNGSPAQTLAKNTLRTGLLGSLDTLATYVDLTAANDPQKIVSSGFESKIMPPGRERVRHRAQRRFYPSRTRRRASLGLNCSWRIMRGVTSWNTRRAERCVVTLHSRMRRRGADGFDGGHDVFHPRDGDGFGQSGDGLVRRGAAHGDVSPWGRPSK